jgi:hypothetical protein
MNYLFTTIILAAFCFSCSNETKSTGVAENTAAVTDTTLAYFGDSITTEGAVVAETVIAQLSKKDSMPAKLSGKIVDVCQKKGCWMELDMGNNQTMRVTFKDYAFFVPKDATGKTAIVDGYVYTDTTSVQQLKHYAHDAGKSKDEIDAITAPEISTSFEARGVIIKK